jgi:hypothetical protein
MSKTLRRLWEWIDRNALMLTALTLSISASGIDGAYLSRLMAPGLAFTGYLLNTVSDVATLVLANWYGRLEFSGTGASKKAIRRVFYSEFVAIAYSWLFSWRQLRPIVRELETVNNEPLLSALGASQWGLIEVEIIVFVMAGFVPVTNAALGYAQALRDGKFQKQERAGKTGESTGKIEERTGKTAEGADKIEERRPAGWQGMSKADRIHYLIEERPELSQASIALEAECSEGYVSKVLASNGKG